MSDAAEFCAALLDPARPTPAGMSPARRFAVYRNNVVVSLIDALVQSFPAIHALVGDQFFRATAGEFVRAHPPRSPVMLDWGGAFPDWIEAFPPAAGTPYLGDVARLEWARIRAYNAAEAAPLGPDALGALGPDALPGARFGLHPSFALIRSRFPVVSLWGDVTGQGATPDFARAETALVVRPDAEVTTRAVSPAFADFLAALAAGFPLGAAVQEAAAGGGFDLAEALGAVFSVGLVVSLE